MESSNWDGVTDTMNFTSYCSVLDYNLIYARADKLGEKLKLMHSELLGHHVSEPMAWLQRKTVHVLNRPAMRIDISVSYCIGGMKGWEAKRHKKPFEKVTQLSQTIITVCRNVIPKNK